MKIIETKLNENQFLIRLDTFCRKKERFDRGYNDKDLYVIKRNKNRRIYEYLLILLLYRQ